MILFDHNRDDVEQCKKLSQDLGFKQFRLIDHGRNAFPVFDQQKNYLYSVGNHDQPIEFKELHDQYIDSTINGYIEPIKTKSIGCQVQKNSQCT